MYASMELRWFFEEEPEEFARMFAGMASQKRVDCYLQPPNAANGIKIREGRLETKLRVSVPQRFAHRGAAGLMEHWNKWGLEFDEDSYPGRKELLSAGWIDVAKTRTLRQLEDCSFELTCLEIAGQRFFSMGFEAFGREEMLYPNLLKGVHTVLDELEHPEVLVLEDSCGYPEFLRRFFKD